MDAGISRARELGIAVTIAIVDAGGHLLMLERMEGGRFHTVHSATTKAVSAASNRRPTSSRGAQGNLLMRFMLLDLPWQQDLRTGHPLEAAILCLLTRNVLAASG